MILNNNKDNKSDKADTKAKDTSGADSGYIEQDVSLHNALTTTELALGLAKATNAPGLEEWFNLKDVSLLALELGSCELQGVPSVQD